MRIGIITHPLLYNYGGILQNYALQQILKGMGHEVYTIDRIPETTFKTKIFSLGKRGLLKITGKKVKLRGWLTREEQNLIYRNTRDFVKQYISTTEKVTSNSKIYSIHEKYNFDAYVVGSDQVWRRSGTRRNDWEFLSFIEGNNEIRKVAYAASFGVVEWEYNDEETEKYRRLAQLFDAVSVREDVGIELCKRYLNVEATHLIDPALLLERDRYISVVEKSDVPKSRGNLFSYVLDRSPRKEEIVKAISTKTNLDSFEVMPEQNFKMELKGGFDIHKCVFPKIEQWLRAFMDAEFVVTDSFHGTAFSILFNKPFLAIINKRRGASRFWSLLRMFDLEQRVIDLEDNFNLDDILRQKIDFNRINQILDRQRERSFDFLKGALDS